MKRCLFLSSRYAPFPGGAETYAHDLCMHLSEFGWQCMVLTDRLAGQSPQESTEGAPIVIDLEGPYEQLRDKRRVLWRTLQFGLLDNISDVISSSPRVDIVHANSIEALILGRIIADHLAVPLVATIHEHAPDKQSFGLGRSKLAFQHLAPDTLIAPSDFYFERAKTAGMPTEKIVKISHGVSVKRVESAPERDWRSEWKVSDSVRCAILIGRIYQPKGVLEFVEAMHILRHAPNVKAVIVGPDGPGEYAEKVRMQISSLGLEDRIILAGEVSPEFIPSIIRSGDLIVAPSLAEGFGLSVVEAMLLKTSVLASRVGGLAEIVHDGVTGELVEPGNVSQLAEAMKKLLQNDDLRQRYSCAAFDETQVRFSASRMAGETAAVYDRLTAFSPR